MSMRQLKMVVGIVVTILCLHAGVALAAEVRLSSTIGPIDAGIVPLLVQKYEQQGGDKVVFEGAGTGATLEKAKKGGFDMVMVHARSLEDAFVAEGYGLDRRDVMYNDFVILGPKADPARIGGMKDAVAALKAIAKAEAPFVTRGDKSGTHVKEMEVWKAAGITPQGAWYETFVNGNKGNKPTTLHANEKGAYVLMDRATWLTLKNDIAITPLVEGDPLLMNYIAVIAVNPAKLEGVRTAEAKKFMDWLVGDEAQTIIRDFGAEKYGQPLFFPNSDQWNAKHGKDGK